MAKWHDLIFARLAIRYIWYGFIFVGGPTKNSCKSNKNKRDAQNENVIKCPRDGEPTDRRSVDAHRLR